MSIDNPINSSNIVVFPASRRNVQFYASRMLSEENYRRVLNSLVNIEGLEGTFIWKYTCDASTTMINDIEFFIAGYYFHLNGREHLNQLNTALASSGDLFFYIQTQDVVTDSDGSIGNHLYELDCKDDSEEGSELKFYGLGYSDRLPEGNFYYIPIVIDGKLNPALDMENGYGKKPYFISSPNWAASSYSDKNKIWIDNQYYVPHVCVERQGTKVWMPLGAVYKTSNN